MLFVLFPVFFVLVLCAELTTGQQVCYNPYGCFSKDAPFNKRWMSLPQSPQDVGTEFHLFTRPMHAKGHLLNPLRISSIQESAFDGSKMTVFMSHGFTGSINSPMNKPMAEALLRRDDMNVIVVAWEKGSHVSYNQAAANCRLVGAQIAYLVVLLHNKTGLDFRKVHLIGFSLGSHVVGYAGKHLQANGHKIARITGLDPAAPLFEGEAIGARLDKSDATFVDIIHTNTQKVAIVTGIGIKKEIGHLDFYVNGGGSQPGCFDLSDGVGKMLSCSHQRSYEYFTESINANKHYKAFPCKTYSDFNEGSCSSCSEFGCPVFGYDSVIYKGPSPGKLFLKTTGTSPFLVDHYKITFKTGTEIFGDLIGGFISVTLKGKRGTSEEVRFNRRTMYRGRLQSFVAWKNKDIGEITELIVRHADPAQKWKLRKVIVQKFDTNQEYMACANLWIGSRSKVIKMTSDNVDNVC